MKKERNEHAHEVQITFLPLRGQQVIPAFYLASALEVETRQIVQTIKRHKEKFPDKYAFQVNKSEQAELVEAGIIEKAGRGGSRALPWLVTRKGVIRLTQIMATPKTLEAAEMFVDVLDSVLDQLYRGNTMIEVERPDLFVPDLNDRKQIRALRQKVLSAVDTLMTTVIDPKTHRTVRDEIGEAATSAANHLKALLGSRQINNEKVEAETVLILEQARDLYERRHSELADAELARERKALENVALRISLVERFVDTLDRLEPNAVISALPGLYLDKTR